jgi:hypothetical protein
MVYHQRHDYGTKYVTQFKINVHISYILECGAKADVVFVLDSSGSVGSANWHLMLKFVQNVVNIFTISIISWRPVLLVEENRVPEENHRPVASH